MKKQNLFAILGLFALFIVAFSSGRVIAPASAQGVVVSVYIMSNSASGNQVIVYSRAPDGTLTWKANYATNGLGINGLTGSNQGGLVLSEDGRWLIVVNASSNDISVFSVNQKGLSLTDKAGSLGPMPISATVHGNVVYVLNTGGSESTGNNAGVASAPNIQSSSGGTPFGFDFTPSGTLIVSEAAGGPSGTSAVSSYTISDSGSLTTLSASVPDTQQAACWLVVTGNGQFAYTANAHSTTISSYTIAGNGKISLLNTKAATVGGTDLDMALARNSRFLYVFDNGDHAIVAYEVHADGSLTWLQTTSGIPAGADGLAAN